MKRFIQYKILVALLPLVAGHLYAAETLPEEIVVNAPNTPTGIRLEIHRAQEEMFDHPVTALLCPV